MKRRDFPMVICFLMMLLVFPGCGGDGDGRGPVTNQSQYVVPPTAAPTRRLTGKELRERTYSTFSIDN